MFTNGKVDRSVTEKATAIDKLRAQGIHIDERPVLRLIARDEGIDVVVKTEDGEELISLGFVAHKPPTTYNAPHLVEQLGLETEMGMAGLQIKTTPFCTTNVPGVFAAGDVGVPMTHVTNAMYTGNISASMAAHYIGDIEAEEALKKWKGN